MKRRFRGADLWWLGAYVGLVVAITMAMFTARDWAIRTLSAEAATASWQEFRADAQRISRGGPVLRRVPPGSEPPTLRLLRDHFPASLAAALFFSSAVFFTLMLLLRGAFSRDSAPSADRFAQVDHPDRRGEA